MPGWESGYAERRTESGYEGARLSERGGSLCEGIEIKFSMTNR